MILQDREKLWKHQKGYFDKPISAKYSFASQNTQHMTKLCWSLWASSPVANGWRIWQPFFAWAAKASHIKSSFHENGFLLRQTQNVFSKLCIIIFQIKFFIPRTCLVVRLFVHCSQSSVHCSIASALIMINKWQKVNFLTCSWGEFCMDLFSDLKNVWYFIITNHQELQSFNQRAWAYIVWNIKWLLVFSLILQM